MYNYNSRVRYSECDKNLNITISALVNYLQDCVSFQSDEVKNGPAQGKENQIGWILSSWQIRINRYPKMSEEITISTWPYKFKGYFAFRNFLVKDTEGNVIAYANSHWLYIDTTNNKMLRIPTEVLQLYTLEPPYPEYTNTSRIKLPDSMDEKTPFKIQKFYIDSNQHVNNEKYILMAMEYMPQNAHVNGVRVEYKKAAVLGNMIYPYTCQQDNKLLVLLGDDEKNPFAVVEFSINKL